MGSTDRVVILIDMDCFYCQVEEKLNPELEGKPIAVVQYNAWRGGGIIAVNYPARDQGITRHMRGNEARKKCPTINIVQVPEVRGKADLSKYRQAGKQVADVLATFTPLLQRASVDEAYLDVTELSKKRIDSNLKDMSIDNLKNTFVVGQDTQSFIDTSIANKDFTEYNLLLVAGGVIAEEIRHKVYTKTGYKCSAGIAHNKILAKLVCALHKPNKQTILSHDAVGKLFETTKISKINSLGGKFGEKLKEDFKINYMHELATIPEKMLTQKYDEKTATFLANIAKGIDLEPVTPKLVSKSIACCKNFTGKAALTTSESIQHWLGELATEIGERLEQDLVENKREAKQIIVSFTQEINKKDVSNTRTLPLPFYDTQKISQSAFEVVKKNCMKSNGSFFVKFLGLNACHFEDIKKVRKITTFFNLGQNYSLQKKSNKKESDGFLYDDLDSRFEKVGKITSFSNLQQDLSNHNKTVTNNINSNNSVRPKIEESVYFQITQELEEDLEELVFYNDTVDNNQDELKSITSRTMNDSSIKTTQKLKQNETSSKGIRSSFFVNYFKTDSKNEEDKHSSIFKNDNGIKKESQSHRQEFHHEELPIIHALNNEETSAELCDECNQITSKSEIQSHKDFHFVLKLSNEDKINFRVKEHIEKPSKGKRNHSTKDNTPKLMMYFKNEIEENHSLPTEICNECQRKINIDEIESHQDHHLAKKLHLEINAINEFDTVMSKTIDKSKGQKKKKQFQGSSVTAFFKPL